MFTEFHRKVSAEHLRRDAFLYVRQSTRIPKPRGVTMSGCSLAAKTTVGMRYARNN